MDTKGLLNKHAAVTITAEEAALVTRLLMQHRHVHTVNAKEANDTQGYTETAMYHESEVIAADDIIKRIREAFDGTTNTRRGNANSRPAGAGA